MSADEKNRGDVPHRGSEVVVRFIGSPSVDRAVAEVTVTDAGGLHLIDEFVAETDEVLDEIERLLLRLEHTREESLLHEIFHGVKTLKHTAAFLQYEQLTQFAHVLEELLDAMREGHIDAATVPVSQLLDAVDALRDIAARSARGSAFTEWQLELFLQLRAVCADISAETDFFASAECKTGDAEHHLHRWRHRA